MFTAVYCILTGIFRFKFVIDENVLSCVYVSSDKALHRWTVYLEKGIQLCFALVEEFLVNRFEGKFAEGRQLQFLQ